ncbi:MAG TPA: GNAT family N-acetyltransferase [Methylophilaceae bacterium]|jgi:cyclohexyl-isocyanide hydratase
MVAIRPLTPDDDVQYVALWQEALVNQSRFFRIALADDPAQHIPTRFTPDSLTIGAFHQARLVGSVSLERDSRIKFAHKALLFKMFVHPDMAGEGVGRQLMKEVMQLAANVAELRQIYLTVLASNTRAAGLYESLGFAVFAHEPQAVHIDDTYVDELQMIYFLR